MRGFIPAIEAEFSRYRALAEAAMAQLGEGELAAAGPGGGDSVATVAWHIGGNLASRFTDFLTADGEKPWRRREEEFAARAPSRPELQRHWDTGWEALDSTLSELDDGDLERSVRIRGVQLRVHEALQRSLAHTSYHVGQIVYLAKSIKGPDWSYLGIPPGGSAAYNRNPTREHARGHAAKLRGSGDGTGPAGESRDP